MRNKDLLNAIDEIDLKYVTQAWENTQPSIEEKIPLGDKRNWGKFMAYGAGIAATLLVGFVAVSYMRGNLRLPTNSGDTYSGITPAVSVSSGNSQGTSNSPENSDTTVTSLPTTDKITADDVETVRKNYSNEQRGIIDTSILDLDYDGKDELLVLTHRANPRVFEVWEKNGGEMENVCDFGTGKVDYIDNIELIKAEVNNEKVYLFTFSYDKGTSMKADEVLSMIRKTADGYEVEHLLSRGTITYSDIAEPFTKNFYRKGWNRTDIGWDQDYGDITPEEYSKLYMEYIGAGSREYGKLYAPDKQTFDYDSTDDNTTVTLGDEIKTITFDNFVYLGTPRNIYNSITDPDFFVPYSANYVAGVQNEALLKLYKQEVPYKRYYVGEHYGDLTLISAETVFIDDEFSGQTTLKSMTASFDGTTTAPFIIYCYDNVYFAIPMPVNVPGGGGWNIPAMSFLEMKWIGEGVKDYVTIGASTPITPTGDVRAYTDVVVRLNNPEEFGLADMISEKGYATAILTLGNVRAEYSTVTNLRDVDLTTASIVNVDEHVDEFNPLIYTRTTDPHTTIDNYFRAYVNWMREDYVFVDVLSAEETTDVEKIIQELLCVNPDQQPLNPDCADLIHDFEVVYVQEGKEITAFCRLIYDANSGIWTVIRSMLL